MRNTNFRPRAAMLAATLTVLAACGPGDQASTPTPAAPAGTAKPEPVGSPGTELEFAL